ncbi:MAG: hypothetical protein HRU36_04215 [Rickettsiales bacterium]|nr:hypothetical protein [Rickettsiales bacterium]
MKQKKTNNYSIISEWMIHEILSNAYFNDPKELVNPNEDAIVQIGANCLPWEKTQKYYYNVILGSFDLKKIFSKLINKNIEGQIILATVTIDNEGNLFIPNNNVQLIANFAYLQHYLTFSEITTAKNKLDKSVIEKNFKELLSTQTVSWQMIEEAYKYLITELGLPEEFLIAPNFAICTERYDPLMINTVVEDLNSIHNRLKVNEISFDLKSYLKNLESETHIDINNHEILTKILSPMSFPTSCWIAREKSPLSISQQAVVNSIINNLYDNDDIPNINVPDTDKIPLLQDVVSEIITKRASSMLDYRIPNQAFSNKSQEVFHLDEKLQGFEIITTSLTGKELLPRDSILKDISNFENMIKKNNNCGIASVSLMNHSDIIEFTESFWEDYLKKYLERSEEKSSEARYQWKDICNKFKTVFNKSRAKLEELEAIKDLHTKYESSFEDKMLLEMQEKIKSEIKDLQIKHQKVAQHNEEQELKKSSLSVSKNFSILSAYQEREKMLAHLDEYKELNIDKIKEIDRKVEKLQNEKNKILIQQQRLLYCSIDKPIWKRILWKLFPTKEYRDWKNKRERLLKEISRDTISNYAKMDEFMNELESKKTIQGELEEIISFKKRLGSDNGFFKGNYVEKNAIISWIDEEINKNRQKVFVEALNVHKAFVEANASCLSNNLKKLVGILRGDISALHPKNMYHLWASLFLIMPVIHINFSLSEKIFSNLPQKSFGWLFIDQAKDYVPQHTLGMVIRAKQAIIMHSKQSNSSRRNLPSDLMSLIQNVSTEQIFTDIKL